MIDKNKLKEKLKVHLGRDPSDKEIENGQTDQSIINEIIQEELEDLRSRVDKLENKK